MMRSTISKVRVLSLLLIVVSVWMTRKAEADFTFGEPVNLGPIVNSSSIDAAPCISADGLSLYFFSLRPGGYGSWDIWVTTRDTTDEDWGPPFNLGPIVNSSANDAGPYVSADGLSLYYVSDRPGGYGGGDIWVTTRPTTDDLWGVPVNLGPSINSSNNWGPSISTDDLSLFFFSLRPGGSGGRDLWVTTRATVSDAWGEPFNLGPLVNSQAEDRGVSVSADGLSLFLDSDRPGGYGLRDLWISKRSTTNDPWGEPFNLGPIVNSSLDDNCPRISPDGYTLYLCTNRPGGFGDLDLYQAPIIPIVDFNGDGKVDGFEVCAMADYWETNDLVCDIGPTPFGDGIVDAEDLKILARCIGQSANDPSLIAHWAFDETTGDIASDSAGEHPGTVTGAYLWYPDAGQVDGALELDGTTFVVTDRVLDPSYGPFSVLAWVQGGAPGQVIVSQDSGSDWLAIDAESGGLTTAVAPPHSRSPTGPLVSDALVSDGLWHRIAFVWDGNFRNLYVDGTLVATDEQGDLLACHGGLYVGCGADQSPGTFFSGLIDDVRIYNRTVRP